MDRTTKLLLAAIALAIWANAGVIYYWGKKIDVSVTYVATSVEGAVDEVDQTIERKLR